MYNIVLQISKEKMKSPNLRMMKSLHKGEYANDQKEYENELNIITIITY